MGMLLRSKKYLEMLLGLDALFERGLHCFHHGGTHNYYLCLENLLDMAAIRAIEDVASTPDKTWKELLMAEARGRDALADAELAKADAEYAALALLPPPLPAAPPVAPPPRAKKLKKDFKVLEAMSFKFPVETATGQKQVSISLDGFSHQSGRRRAYCKCVHENHVNCHLYIFLHNYGHAWKAVASLLISLRAGILAEDKMEHKRLYAPSDADIESVRAELPDILFDIPAEL